MEEDMKVGILTFHNAHNYGAVLQAYALKKTIVRLGHDAVIVNYRNPIIDKKYSEKLSLDSQLLFYLPPWRWWKLLRNLLRNYYTRDTWVIQCKKFNDFITKYLLDGNTEIIFRNNIDSIGCDALISGSDQIWSKWITGTLDSVYFLDIQTEARKIAYAPSISNPELVNTDKKYFKHTLTQYYRLSTREESLSKIISEITEKKVVTVLDPTLLLNVDEYKYLESSHLISDNFVFAYFVTEDKILKKCADYVSRKLNVKLIELHYYNQKSFDKTTQKSDIGPEEFLEYINKSKFVLTNSFHGTILSILYHKEFYSVYHSDSRKSNLLLKFGLEHRHIMSIDQINLTNMIDYTSVDKILSAERRMSLDYLQEALS